ncbi:hypothetical protein D3C75_1313710 [compost metagenome]
MYPQYALNAGLIHPACRSRVPGPATTTNVRRDRVDICRHDIGFNLVAFNVSGILGMIDGVEQREQVMSLVALPEP